MVNFGPQIMLLVEAACATCIPCCWQGTLCLPREFMIFAMYLGWADFFAGITLFQPSLHLFGLLRFQNLIFNTAVPPQYHFLLLGCLSVLYSIQYLLFLMSQGTMRLLHLFRIPFWNAFSSELDRMSLRRIWILARPPMILLCMVAPQKWVFADFTPFFIF